MKQLRLTKKNNAAIHLLEGMSIRKAAEKANISIASAGNIQRELKNSIPPPKYGGPSKVSKVTKRVLARNFELGRLGTLQEGQRFIESIERVHVDKRSIKRYLDSEGIKKYLKQRMPDLTQDHMLARLKFAKEHLHWTLEDWKHVMFSDEATIYRVEDLGRRFYYKHKGSKDIRPHQVKRRKKGGGGNIMIWGCITYYGVGDACRLPEGIDKETVIAILHDHVFASRDWYGMNPEKFKFQQDNASVHTANIVKDYIRKSRIPIIEWPPNSPDLNLIETVWAYLKDQLSKYSTDPRDKDELWKRVQDIWTEIPIDFLHNLYESMPRMMRLVVESRGGHINTKS